MIYNLDILCFTLYMSFLHLSLSLVFLFNGISTFVGYLMTKLFSSKNSSGTILPITGRIRGFIPFPKGICPKVNVTARLEYERAYYDSAVHRFNHYTTTTTPSLIVFSHLSLIDQYIRIYVSVYLFLPLIQSFNPLSVFLSISV